MPARHLLAHRPTATIGEMDWLLAELADALESYIEAEPSFRDELLAECAPPLVRLASLISALTTPQPDEREQAVSTWRVCHAQSFSLTAQSLDGHAN